MPQPIAGFDFVNRERSLQLDLVLEKVHSSKFLCNPRHNRVDFQSFSNLWNEVYGNLFPKRNPKSVGKYLINLLSV